MNCSELEKRLEDPAFGGALSELCAGPEEQETHRLRLLRTARTFRGLYGDCDVRVYSAPGRTEIGGNHTDHQGGRVLAAAVSADIVAVAAAGGDEIRVASEGFPEDRLDPAALSPVPAERGTSAALIRGICAGLAAAGGGIGGFAACTQSEVLPGSGLSSSAAFEVLIGRIADDLFCGGGADPVRLAQLGQRAENEYFGKPCGLMDQTASAVGGFSLIDFSDARRPQAEKIPFDFSRCGYRLCMIDTGGSHSGLTADYAAIPEEMGRAAACFGKALLSRVDEAEFLAGLPLVRRRAGDRAALRALHFFGENRRVSEEAAALRENRFADFLRLVNESGRSSFLYLQNAYPPSRPEEQGMPVALALCERLLAGADGAWRLQGGGFAGAVQAYVPAGDFESFRREMDRVFGEGACRPLSVRGAGAVRVL